MWHFEEPVHHDHIPPIVAENVHILLVESRRWKAAAIHDSPEVVKQLLTPLQVHAPLLEVLELSISNGSFDGELIDVAIQAAPIFRSVHLYEGCFNLSLSPSTAKNIRDLELGYSSNAWANFASPDSSLALLANCTSLETASITILGEWSDPPVSTSGVVAQCLRCLDVIIPPISYNFVIAPFFDKLTLPALRHLKLEIEAEESVEMPFLEIQSLLSRSAASLTSLDLCRRCPPIVQPISQLLEILELTPQIEDLTLVDLNVTDTLISALTPEAYPSEPPTFLCHRLRDLVLVRSELSANAVISMITARWAHSKEPLRTIRLFGCNFGDSGSADIEIFRVSDMAITMGLKLEMVPKSNFASLDGSSISSGGAQGDE
ncbi:hypothetical protein BD410DRAFT_901689 [Rickenella mellea]|uniref:F-box domain-containing protein n=1 Tax=Rickenella mellea TaxID=50990 RepID=A0A4Y7PNC9_9AGAM|nr:hypothetical protein BD410DRAFT_901689 [Rickenella mellea]